MNNSATHLSDAELARYRERKMQPVELLEADDHLALCDACYARLSRAQAPPDKLLAAAGVAFAGASSASEPVHLTYEQMAALVDDKLDEIDREVLASHLELCERCEMEFNDLRELSHAMATASVEAHEPLPRAQMPRAQTFSERFISLWRLQAFRLPAQAAAALAILLLAVLLITTYLRRDETAGPRAQVAEPEAEDLNWTDATVKTPPETPPGPEEPDAAPRAVQAPAQTLVALSDGNSRVTLDSGGNLTGLNAAPREEQAVKDALRNGRARLPSSLRELRGQSGTLMGDGGDGFSLLSPVGVVVESNRPALSWSPLEGAASYTVTVFDANLAQVATSAPLQSTQWTPSAPLARGQTYVWQVRANIDGREVVAPPPAAARVKFRVLEEAKVESLTRARRMHARSHLVLGVMYAEAGLLDEAEREFRALLQANPQSRVARRLLESVRAARR